MMTGTPIEQHGMMPIGMHDALDEVPALVQHSAPPLTHHDFGDADFWIDPTDLNTVSSAVGDIEQMLAAAHQQTGLDVARAKYGFRGTGQTVAVIDSGIAWNHYALGNGLGAQYRVVGGWDFAENDSNPFDDGASGSHGTHVAGIIGANDGSNSGVASDVDIVGLRVFTDTGSGYFEWVEMALTWVYNNRNAFENPITAVNLSLGTTWNAATIPSWAMLEEEFALLKSAGIFVAVSAGNSYANYNTPGLSYPAASPNVVPVMSTDDDGALSFYSQRHSRAIAAPGRNIWSTVPDYLGNNNGISDDWANKSGTSMAAPYVAGASVLIRQAMQFVGMTGITQDTIYNHMMATADSIVDAAGNTYKRLNMNSALTALMPADDYGSTTGTAFNLGSIGTASTSRAGLIGTSTDADYFSFTASVSGTVTLTAANLTNGVGVNWLGTGLSGTGNSRTLQVVAGQTYTFGLQSTGGIGYYSLQTATQSSVQAPTVVDWGTVAVQTARTGLSNTGEKWYRVTAATAGFFTAEVLGGSGAVQLDLYNNSYTLLANGGSAKRTDFYATAGQQFLLKCTGTDSNFSLRMTNAVATNGLNVTVAGTAAADTITLVNGVAPSLTFNGVTYAFNSNTSKNFTINCEAGADIVTVTGTTAAETFIARFGDVRLVSGASAIVVLNAEDVTVNGGGGADIANFYDTASDDLFDARIVRGTMTGSVGGVNYRHYANNFAALNAFATAGGTDRVNITDWLGDDVITVGMNATSIRAANGWYLTNVSGFDNTYVYATSGGVDVTTFNDTAGNDLFVSNHFEGMMWGGAGGYAYVRTLGLITSTATAGNDRAYFYDSPVNDTFTATPTTAEIRATDGRFRRVVTNYDAANAFAVAGGVDTAYLYDSAGSDTFFATPTFAWMQATANTTYSNYCSNFEVVEGFASAGGSDVASLNDSAGDDLFVGGRTQSRLSAVSNAYQLKANSFDWVLANASAGGNDVAELYDTTGVDWFYAQGAYAQLWGGDYFNRATGFGRVKAIGSGGTDTVNAGAIDFVFERLGTYA